MLAPWMNTAFRPHSFNFTPLSQSALGWEYAPRIIFVFPFLMFSGTADAPSLPILSRKPEAGRAREAYPTSRKQKSRFWPSESQGGVGADVAFAGNDPANAIRGYAKLPGKLCRAHSDLLKLVAVAQTNTRRS